MDVRHSRRKRDMDAGSIRTALKNTVNKIDKVCCIRRSRPSKRRMDARLSSAAFACSKWDFKVVTNL